jgi:hypothetical protein
MGSNMRLIIDATTGTVLNIDECYIVDTEKLDDHDDELLENASDSELSEIARRVGKSVKGMGQDTGWGDNSYAYTVSYSPLSIKDECDSFIEGGIYDESDREWHAVKWVLETATLEQIADISSWVMSNEGVWDNYRSNIMEFLMLVHKEYTEEKK